MKPKPKPKPDKYRGRIIMKLPVEEYQKLLDNKQRLLKPGKN